MNITFITHYFPPEVGAPQARIYELAKLLMKYGDNVTVLTGFPNYPTGIIPKEYRHKIFQKEKLDGINVVRTWVYATPNKGFIRRIINHLSFAMSSVLGIVGLGKCDIVIAESPPLFVGIAGYIISKLKKAFYIFNVADLWPQSAIELGMLRNRLLTKVAQLIESFIYWKADKIFAVTPGIMDALIKRDLPKDKIRLITNGVDTDFFKPLPPNALIRKKLCLHNLDEKFIVLYAGTHGLSHGLDTVMKAAQLLSYKKDIVFLFVGDGAEKSKLIYRAQKHSLSNVIFWDTQPRSFIPSIISAANVCLVPLRKLPVFKGALPSKIFEAMACECPIILGVEGIAKDLIMRANAGICVEPENPDDLVKAILKLYNDRDLAVNLGKNGRSFVMRNFERDKIVRELRSILIELIDRKHDGRCTRQ